MKHTVLIFATVLTLALGACSDSSDSKPEQPKTTTFVQDDGTVRRPTVDEIEKVILASVEESGFYDKNEIKSKEVTGPAKCLAAAVHESPITDRDLVSTLEEFDRVGPAVDVFSENPAIYQPYNDCLEKVMK